MKGKSKGTLFIASAFAAFALTAPTAAKAVPTEGLRVSPTRQQILVSHAAEKAIKNKLGSDDKPRPFRRAFTRFGNPWIQYH